MGRARRLLGLLAAWCVVCAAAWPILPGRPLPPASAASEPDAWLLPYRLPAARPSTALETALLAMINRARAGAHVAPVLPDAALQREAVAYAREVFASGYLAHVSRGGLTPRARIAAAGLDVLSVGENLAYAANIRAAQNAMMASPSHRENILYPAFRFVGIGVTDGGARGVVVVEDFTDVILSRTLSRGNAAAQAKPVTQ